MVEIQHRAWKSVRSADGPLERQNIVPAKKDATEQFSQVKAHVECDRDFISQALDRVEKAVKNRPKRLEKLYKNIDLYKPELKGIPYMRKGESIESLNKRVKADQGRVLRYKALARQMGKENALLAAVEVLKHYQGLQGSKLKTVRPFDLREFGYELAGRNLKLSDKLQLMEVKDKDGHWSCRFCYLYYAPKMHGRVVPCSYDEIVNKMENQ